MTIRDDGDAELARAIAGWGWIALDYAMVLTAAGDLKRARKCLDAATTSQTLLPEEEIMARRTRAALDQASEQRKTP